MQCYDFMMHAMHEMQIVLVNLVFVRDFSSLLPLDRTLCLLEEFLGQNGKWPSELPYQVILIEVKQAIIDFSII